MSAQGWNRAQPTGLAGRWADRPLVVPEKLPGVVYPLVAQLALPPGFDSADPIRAGSPSGVV